MIQSKSKISKFTLVSNQYVEHFINLKKIQVENSNGEKSDLYQYMNNRQDTLFLTQSPYGLNVIYSSMIQVEPVGVLIKESIQSVITSDLQRV